MRACLIFITSTLSCISSTGPMLRWYRVTTPAVRWSVPLSRPAHMGNLSGMSPWMSYWLPWTLPVMAAVALSLQQVNKVLKKPSFLPSWLSQSPNLARNLSKRLDRLVRRRNVVTIEVPMIRVFVPKKPFIAITISILTNNLSPYLIDWLKRQPQVPLPFLPLPHLKSWIYPLVKHGTIFWVESSSERGWPRVFNRRSYARSTGFYSSLWWANEGTDFLPRLLGLPNSFGIFSLRTRTSATLTTVRLARCGSIPLIISDIQM